MLEYSILYMINYSWNNLRFNLEARITSWLISSFLWFWQLAFDTFNKASYKLHMMKFTSHHFNFVESVSFCLAYFPSSYFVWWNLQVIISSSLKFTSHHFIFVEPVSFCLAYFPSSYFLWSIMVVVPGYLDGR
jgi:hypothetical protein